MQSTTRKHKECILTGSHATNVMEHSIVSTNHLASVDHYYCSAEFPESSFSWCYSLDSHLLNRSCVIYYSIALGGLSSQFSKCIQEEITSLNQFSNWLKEKGYLILHTTIPFFQHNTAWIQHKALCSLSFDIVSRLPDYAERIFPKTYDSCHGSF